MKNRRCMRSSRSKNKLILLCLQKNKVNDIEDVYLIPEKYLQEYKFG